MGTDWGKIETDYMAGKLTYRQIAEKYGIDASTVARHGKKAGWVKKRKQYASKIHARAASKAASRRANREAKVLAGVGEVAETLLRQIRKALEDEEQLYRWVLMTGKGRQGEVTIEKLDTKALKDLVEASRVLAGIARDVGGILTEQQVQQLAMARDRLAFDRERAALTDEAEEGGVIELAPVAEEDAPCREVELNAGDMEPTTKTSGVHGAT